MSAEYEAWRRDAVNAGIHLGHQSANDATAKAVYVLLAGLIYLLDETVGKK